MKQTHLFWLGGVLVLAILVAYLAGVFETDMSTVQVPELRISPEEVTAIDLESSESAFSLQRTAEGWKLKEPVEGKADSVTVTRFLDDLDALELTSVVSRSPERYGRFGVDSSGMAVTLTRGDTKQTVIIGERSSDYASNYIRLEEDERVFLSRKAVDIPRDLDRWRDRTILRVSPREVVSAAVTGPDRNYSLTREGTGWTIDGAAADSGAVERWLGRLNPLNADGFYERMETDADSSFSLVLQLSNNRTQALRFVPQDNDYAVETSGAPISGTGTSGTGTIYLIRSMRIDQFVPERSYFASL